MGNIAGGDVALEFLYSEMGQRWIHDFIVL